MFDNSKIISELERNWHKPWAPILLIVIAISFEILVLNSLNATVVARGIVYIITVAVVYGIWLYCNRYPKTPSGKLGFVVSIQCSNEEENRKIREDFVDTLRKLLKKGTFGKIFHFIEIPQHITKNINDEDDALNLRVKTKAYFIIYGRVRLRSIGGKDCYILNLEGLVAHKQLPQEISNQLANEFGELFPRHVRISTENDLLSFNFTTDWTECVAKYIIGIASALSLNLDYAEQLYADVEKKLESYNTDFPIFNKLKQRIPIRLSEIYKTRARAAISTWRKNHDHESLSQFNINVNKIPKDLPEDYEVLILRGIEAFFNERDIETALSYVNKCKKYDGSIWHFNLAFLHAYNEDLKTAIRQYRICENYDISSQTRSEVEDFLVWILEEEPDKYQFHYLLGFFNWKIKGDLMQAKTDFMKFLSKYKNKKFEIENKLTETWLLEIKKQINQADN